MDIKMMPLCKLAVQAKFSDNTNKNFVIAPIKTLQWKMSSSVTNLGTGCNIFQKPRP